jgi:hypothetical protein
MAKGKKAQAYKSDQERQPAGKGERFGSIPLWGWIAIFVLPLVVSELMFYRVGRTLSMVLFPIAWVGFWVTVMQRRGWPILRKRQKK